jgi:methyl halide transferase
MSCSRLFFAKVCERANVCGRSKVPRSSMHLHSSGSIRIRMFSVDSRSENKSKINPPINEKAHFRWGKIWEAGIAPGEVFDAGSVSPCLLNEIAHDRIPQGSALVPGCGRGYDVFALAGPNRSVLGIDLVEQAIHAAKEEALNHNNDVDKEIKKNIEFEIKDFFQLNDKYDFIYDYTFLCALDPCVHNDWANQMANITKPNGLLLTLVFPICDKESGPPFKMSLELLENLLMSGSQKGKWEKLQLELLPSALCHPGRDGIGSSMFGETEVKAKSGIGRWRRTTLS